MKKISNYLTEELFVKKYFSPDCEYLIKNIFFSNFTETTLFFIKKLLIDSTNNKNDFLTYENCLEDKNFWELENLNFTVKPIFVIGIIDDINNKNKFKNSILNEKYNYLNSFCLPYGLYKNEKYITKSMCTAEDYNKIISFEKNISYIKTIFIKIIYLNQFNIFIAFSV